MSLRDDNTTLAIAAGIVAALVAGGLWAMLVRITGYEIGYAAWGVGVLVGVAMSRVTVNRSRQLAVAAAGFALVGLTAGKVFIFLASTGTFADELKSNDEWMAAAVAWTMYDERQLDAATMEEVTATIAAGDTLSDAVWLEMTTQAGRTLQAMSADERDAAARDAAAATLGRIGVVNGVVGQLTAFDLLWVLLAVGSAYRAMAAAQQAEPAELQPA
jgi:hypothetical protein